MPKQVTIAGETFLQVDLNCPECGKFMVLDKRSKGGLYYRCSTKTWTSCPGSHSCHPDGTPLGIPGDAFTKAARMKAHHAFDKLWKERGMRRGEAYRLLQGVMGMSPSDAHIGRFTVEQCEKLLDILESRHGIRRPNDMLSDDDGFVEFGFGYRGVSLL